MLVPSGRKRYILIHMLIKSTIKEFEGKVAYAHRAQNLLVDGLPDKCWFPHGHNLSYKIEVECPILKPEVGMGLTFGEIKNIVEEEITQKWDHTMFVDIHDTLMMNFATALRLEWEKLTPPEQRDKCMFRVVVFPYPTSIENLAQYMWDVLDARFTAAGTTLRKVTLMETPTSGHSISR